MDVLLTASWVLPVASPPLRQGAVLVRGERILRVGPAAELASEASESGRDVERWDFGEAAILPGLVNAHAHLDLAAFRGRLEAVDFYDWIRKLALVKERLDLRDLVASARWGALELLSAGVTAVGETSENPAAVEALRDSGLRGVAYTELFGPDERECDARLRDLEERLEARRRLAPQRVRIGVSPHAPYTVSEPLFRRVAAMAGQGAMPLAVHAAESEAERAFVVEGRGPFADLLRSRAIPVVPRGPSTLAWLEYLGVLQARPLLIHAVRLGPADLQRIRDAGAAVAHCPKSNAKLRHGIAPLAELLALGVPTGIGTDGAPSSNGCDLLEEARFAVLLQRARAGLEPSLPDARTALRLLTLEGARALGLAEETGSLEPGKAADIAVFRLSGPRHEPPGTDVEASLVFSGSASDTLLTMVDGRVLFREGQVLSLDADEARGELRRAAAKLDALPEAR